MEKIHYQMKAHPNPQVVRNAIENKIKNPLIKFSKILSKKQM